MRNEYPRPDFKRDSFVSLNGTWEFCFDDYNVGHKEKWFVKHDFDKKIEVPFSFETKLSGIHDTTYHDHVWYHKNLKILNLVIIICLFFISKELIIIQKYISMAI